jgi:hypothetical protein
VQKNLVLAGLLTISSAAFGADPKLLNLVMPDAKVLAGANVTTAKISPLGQYLISQLQGNGAQFKSLIALTGFDPFADVTEVLAASTADPAKPGGLVLMDGNFNVVQIVGALQSRNNSTIQANIQTYAGATLVTFVDPNAKINPAVAFIGTGIALAGDTATVEAALDRNGNANSIDPGLATRVNALSGSDDAWVVGDAPLSSLLSGNAAAAAGPAGQALQILQNIQLGSMNLAKDPQTAGLMQLLQALQVSTSGAGVDIALSVPEGQMEGLLKTITLPSKAKTPGGN